MNRKSLLLLSLVLLTIAALAGCDVAGPAGAAQAQPAPTAAPQPTVAVPDSAGEVLAALEATLQRLYTQVNPSVVNLRVVRRVAGFGTIELPFELPFGQDTPQTPQTSQALGSGFVWDDQGHIVTNNHVVAGAGRIHVTFYDGTTVEATLVGSDPYSDLAVLKVDVPAEQLRPLPLAAGEEVKVGDLCAAIGNPFGLEGTMTVGFVSAVGRTLPTESTTAQGGSYSIPDVIQTDAPINPGNSGGALVNDAGQLIGVTTAIESTSGSSAGVGFAVPATIVQKVVPALIETGRYEHPWLGISGTSLTPDLAEAMGLPAGQRGALVLSTVADGPAAKAGLRGSSTQATIDGQDVQVGGDVIVAIDGTAVQDMDTIISYLANHTSVGQVVTLTVLRQGQETPVPVTLGVRPAQVRSRAPQESTAGGAYLGIYGLTVSADLARAMGLAEGQEGVLVQRVVAGSPAEQAGLRGSDRETTIGGRSVLVGGDIITAVDGEAVTTMEGLQAILGRAEPGRQVTLTLLRDGQSVEVTVTLAARPASTPS